MNETTVRLLEYDKIKEKLMEYAVSEPGKNLVRKLQPSIDIQVIKGWLNETTEARALVDRYSAIPLYSLSGIDQATDKLGKGTVLHPEELTIVFNLLEGGRRVKKFMEGKEGAAPTISLYARSIYELGDLAEEIGRCIVNESIDDKASPELFRVRKKILITEERIKSKLESILRSPAYSAYIQDAVVSLRGGRYVIPVKKEHRRNIEGVVLDTSISGSTIFIEPEGVRKLQDELNLLKIEEEREEYRILSCLTGMIESHQREISINIETMAHYDFVFAKAKYSRAIEGNAAELNTRNYIRINGAKHPLIGRSAIPLDFEIGNGYKALVITGPNTGGKTVVLKTVGLLTMMVQSGLHVPAEKGSEFAVFRDILADIGDGQSIEQSLSTFSSHIKNIIGILECADPYTLVIMDELGAGTDPAEGMGLAVSVLEDIYRKEATLLATTHYSEIKGFASEREGFENGCMEFDIETLKPLYRLKIGKAGESNAFLIALRLGIDRKVIERAHEITYKEKKEYIYKPKLENNGEDRVVKAAADSGFGRFHMQQVIKQKETADARKRVNEQKVEQIFKLGDCVFISSMGRTGIVCELENSKGEVGVMVMKKRLKVNKKRLSLYIDGQEMYPDDYDFDIVLETKENRRKRHQMARKHVEGMVIEIGKE